MVNNSEDQIREYMISRAKTCLSLGDSSYAKSWVMTANALFPQNNKIKMESYEMSKTESNVEEAVKYLCEMFDTKECEPELRQELCRILIACRNEWQTTYRLTEQQIQSVFGFQQSSPQLSPSSQQFYTKLFAALSPEYQYKLLRRVSDRTEDKLVLIDLLLFILKKFPESVVENGIKLIEIMDEKHWQSSTNSSSDGLGNDSDQHLRQYLKRKLVFDVLPVIFAQNSKLNLDFDIIQTLMQKTLKYFIERVIASLTNDNNSTDSHNMDTNSGHMKSTGNKESDELLESKIKEIFQLIGNKNDWKLFKIIDFESEKQFEVIYDKIAHFIDENRYSGDTDSPMDLSSASTAMISVRSDEQTSQQILYSTLVLFVLCLRRYSTLSSDIALIEESNQSLIETKIAIKKRKLIESPELLTNNFELKQIFVVMSKALKLLNENVTISSEFPKISEIIGLNGCQTYHSFVIDSNIYRADYNEVLSLILSRKSLNIKQKLQLISVSLSLHDYNQTLRHCIESVESLPQLKYSKETTAGVVATKEVTHESVYSLRKLYFIPLNIDRIMDYIIEVLILCLRDRVLLSLKPTDLGVGHLLVLSQYKWPKNVQLFLTCMSFIRNGGTRGQSTGTPSQPKFSYHQFFSYILIPDVIEEFMSCVELRDILLELKPSNQTLGTALKSSSKVITTRGVNKCFKEENRSALVQQMKVSKTQIPNDLFIEFINKEIRSFCFNN